ncbi:MAG: LytTR family DNA-binding domain-containing protein [Bacteroidota bacterium]
MIKAVIVEDEINGLNNLKNLLSKYCEEVQVVGEATNITEGLALFGDSSIQPDVAFLDINLPDGTVFQLLNQLKGKVEFDIIFVTAYEKFAVKACQYSSIGFIVKPIDPDELKDAVSRIRSGRSNKISQRLDLFTQHYNNPNAFEKMSISALDGIYFINIRDIIRCEAEDNYTHIHLKDGNKITASKTIKAYEDMLSGVNFYRVHKSHLINLNYMRKFVKGDGGYLIMDDNKRIEVSRRRRPAFMEQMRRIQEGL